MVKLEDSKGKIGEGFVRIFGNQDMGVLFSKVQSAMIRSGFELEQLLELVIPTEKQTTLEQLNAIDAESEIPDIQVVFKPSSTQSI